jgi:monofunctional biosynthetic peptidoglycan transglycosylase
MPSRRTLTLFFSLGLGFGLSTAACSAMSTSSKTTDPAGEELRIIASFDRDAGGAWPAQNDNVMGGVSTGGSTIVEGRLVFSGRLSLENNGGFAQVFTPSPVKDISPYQSVVLRVRGDGRRYQFRLASEARFRGSRIAYRAEFATEAGLWTEVELPLRDFRPSHHGRILSGPALDTRSITQLALLIADGQAGPFSLEVDWIGLR